jgi:RHS repeat-associated protein
MSLGWSYNTGADNGNVMGHTIGRSSGLAAPLTQTYAYLDPANRLYSASETGGWAQTFNYDAFGNRAVTAGSYMPNGGVTPVQGAPANQFPNNQWIRGAVSTSADKYDGAGNQIQLAQADGVYVTPASTFAYDGENRLLTASIGNQNGATFAYDGEGRRVQKTSASGVVTTYVHDAMGNLAMELSTAAPAAAGTQYLTADFLGSTRLITDGSGNPQRCIDYLPFGEEIPQNVNGRTGPCYETLGNGSVTAPTPEYPAGADVADQKFTGKERDAETGLDYFGARYFSGAQGRFTSPDPSNQGIDFYYPQSWNHYAYAVNNPFSLVDRNGLWPTWVHNDIIDKAFPGLSNGDRQILKAASENTDSDQSLEGAYKHGMANGSDPNGSVHAAMDSANFIATNEHNAESIQAAWIASGHTGIAPGALTAFGNALHTITDETSPSHENFQPWYGLGLFDLPEAGYHFVREAWPWGGNQERQQNAIADAHLAFLRTFGSDVASQAEQPRQPKKKKKEVVSSKICYNTDKGQACQ